MTLWWLWRGGDRSFLGVHPDYLIHVRADILYEIDGPMLRHGLQGLQGQRIVVPSRVGDRPDEGRLGVRRDRFLGVGRVGVRSVY